MRNCAILWFTGLSGSGKTTIAEELAKTLRARGDSVKILDGDVVRSELHQHLGFTPENIKENNRLIAELCIQYRPDFDYIVVPIIAPFRQSRKKAREAIGEGFMEIFIRASLDEVIRRDVKGLYKKALAGKIDNFIGISPNVPYEEPLNPDLVIDTQEWEVETSVNKLLEVLGEKAKQYT